MSDNFPDVAQFSDAGMRGDCWIVRLVSPFRYISCNGVIKIPKGFYTDGASVPRIFWSIFHPYGRYFTAALVHDFLYSKDSDELFYVSDRKQADLIFRQAMQDIGVGWLTRCTIYRAVRLGGGFSYKKKFSKEK